MSKHLSDAELQAEVLAADMFQAEILLNDGERNAALWQRIPDTLRRFAEHDHAPETLPDAGAALAEVNTACAALVKPARVVEAYRSVTGAHLARLARDPYGQTIAATAHRAVAQYAATLRDTARAADSLTRALTHLRAAHEQARGTSTDA